MKRSNKTKLIINFLLLLITILFSIIVLFLILEAYLRLFNPQRLNPLQYSKTRIWEYVPNYGKDSNLTLQINSKGLRDTERAYLKGGNATRIMLLGDSFFEAAQVRLNQTCAKRLEQMLNEHALEHAQPGYEVINAGFSMYGTEQELIYLEEEGIKYDPDIVILGFFVGNDVGNNNALDLFIVENDALIRNNHPTKSPDYRRRVFMASHSHAYIFYKILKYEIKEYLAAEEPEYQVPDNSMAVFMNGNPLDQAWLKTELIINEMKSFCDQNGIELIVAIIPDKRQIDNESLLSSMKRWNLSEDQVDMDLPQKNILEFCRRRGIAVIDLMPEFLKRNTDNTFYGTADTHWNEAGNSLAAEIISRELGRLAIQEDT